MFHHIIEELIVIFGLKMIKILILVGATIHYLSDGIDDGRIISHATSEFHPNPLLHSMSTVKSAFFCLKQIIKKRK